MIQQMAVLGNYEFPTNTVDDEKEWSRNVPLC